MKSKLTRVAAAALAMSMCVPAAVFAADTSTESTGSFNTSFGVYSPKLNISVPLKADVEINPLTDSNDTGVKQFTVASKSIDILNASVDEEADSGIPVNVTVSARITSVGSDVVTTYNTFTTAPTSTKKKIYLELTEAATAATLDTQSAAAQSANAKLLDLGSVTIDDAAVYTGATKKAPITRGGSLLSIDIAAPDGDASNGGKFTAAPAKVTPKVGSFAVTGVANANAAWKADDLAVAITYNVKASAAVNLAQATVGTAPTVTVTDAGAAADLDITVTGVGESKVTAMAVHNDEVSKDEIIWAADAYKVDYATTGTAKITIDKGDSILKEIGKGSSGQAQDLAILLSDGRVVVTTLTVTKSGS